MAAPRSDPGPKRPTATDTTPLRVGILDDHQVVVAGLTALLRRHDPSIRVVEMDHRMVSIDEVDIVLLDTHHPARGGDTDVHDLVRQAARSGARVVAYSWTADARSAELSLSRGARGHLWKGLVVEDLVEALLDVRAGLLVVRPVPASPVPPGERLGAAPTRRPDWDHGLTPREAEVVALIAKGLTNPKIADELYLSVNSVKTYIRTAYRKMGVASRTQAVLWAVTRGFDLVPAHARVVDGAAIAPHRTAPFPVLRESPP